MKKSYLKPAEKIAELGPEANLLQGIVSMEQDTAPVNPNGPGEGGEGEVKRESIWDKVW